MRIVLPLNIVWEYTLHCRLPFVFKPVGEVKTHQPAFLLLARQRHTHSFAVLSTLIEPRDQISFDPTTAALTDKEGERNEDMLHTAFRADRGVWSGCLIQRTPLDCLLRRALCGFLASKMVLE
jgi:hypothetical protein